MSNPARRPTIMRNRADYPIASSIRSWPARSPAVRHALVELEHVCPDCGWDIEARIWVGTAENRKRLPAKCRTCGWQEEGTEGKR